MSWAGQLWKQYDPINKIIFPGVGARPTYNERGTSRARGPRGTSSPRSKRVERVASSRSETTDSTNTPFDFFRRFSQTRAHANDFDARAEHGSDDATRRDAGVSLLHQTVGRRFFDIFFSHKKIFTRRLDSRA